MHAQRTPNSCGPDCVGSIAAQFGISQAAVDAAFGVKDISEFSDLLDSPAHHEAAFRALNLTYRVRTCGEILRGECVNGRCEVLLHAKENPDTWWPESWGSQHWAVVENVDDRHVWLNMGYEDMRFRGFTHKAFTDRYAIGGPTATAYEITGLGQAPKQAWYQRLWVWITRKIK
jgi:hypothetical protein